jgi:hypothetical protein
MISMSNPAGRCFAPRKGNCRVGTGNQFALGFGAFERVGNFIGIGLLRTGRDCGQEQQQASPDKVSNLLTLNSLIVCQVVSHCHCVNVPEALSVYPDAGAQRSSPSVNKK